MHRVPCEWCDVDLPGEVECDDPEHTDGNNVIFLFKRITGKKHLKHDTRNL